MAKQVGGAGAIALLEEGTHLLRRTPLSTLACHWIGSVPLALAALRYWSDIGNPRTSDAQCAAEAAGLALLLVWMNCWRAVFAGRLSRQLSGSRETPWTARRLSNLLAVQSLAGATRLPMMVIASLVVFPLSATVSFYRNIAVLGDREDLDPTQMFARARQLAGRRIEQGWMVLPILALLWLVLALNLAMFLGFLPYVVRALTGYESSFSRSGQFFVLNPLFAMLVIAVSWIAFDPFVQAVYCVRCFEGESMETGANLRAGLRALRTPVAMLLLLLAVAHRSPAVAPEELEQAVHQAMQSHEYDWRLPQPPPSAVKNSWLQRLADRMVTGLRALGRAAADGLERLLRWLFGENFPAAQPGAPPARGLHWSVYALMALVIGIALWMAWLRRRMRSAPPLEAAPVGLDAIRLDAEDLTPDRLPEERWLDLAEQCLREHNLRLALRAFYLANLAWLGRRQLISIHPGKTNREYQAELRRRARESAGAQQLFDRNVTSFERAWYGLHEVAADDVSDFRRRMDEMKRLAA